jgi:phosphomannomutase/phosphoglucomutase
MEQKRLFGTNGIRGIPGKDLTLEFVSEMGLAIGTFFNKGTILIAHDVRNSSPTLARSMMAGLEEAGIDVALAGLLPTPAAQFGIRKFGYNGGVIITASHNPPEYNGIKACRSSGVEVTREDERTIEKIYYDKSFKKADWKTIGQSTEEPRGIRNYIDGVISKVNADAIEKRKLTVVMDTGNGAQSIAAPNIGEELGCKLISLNGHPDGNFPGRGAEPTPETLSALSKAVIKYNADFGVGYDGDGDRSIFCDEKGVIHYGDRSGAILTDHVLRTRGAGLVVTTIATSQVVDDVAEKHGTKVLRTRVGSVDVSKEMITKKAIFGLEENGGCFFAPHIEVRDGGMTAALMMELLSMAKEPLSSLIAKLPKYHQMKLKFECPIDKRLRVIEEVKQKAQGKLDTSDGLKVLDDKTWILLRPSGTEPILRLFGESDNKEKLETMMQKYKEMVLAAIKVLHG